MDLEDQTTNDLSFPICTAVNCTCPLRPSMEKTSPITDHRASDGSSKRQDTGEMMTTFLLSSSLFIIEYFFNIKVLKHSLLVDCALNERTFLYYEYDFLYSVLLYQSKTLETHFTMTLVFIAGLFVHTGEHFNVISYSYGVLE